MLQQHYQAQEVMAVRTMWRYIFQKSSQVEEFEIADVNSELDWSKLHELFEASFKLGGKEFVGSVTQCGFQLKLNKSNLFPFIPTVEVRKMGGSIKGKIKYDHTTKLAQIYWNSIWFFGGSLFLIGTFLQLVDPRKSKEPVLGGVITSVVIFAILFFFLHQRKILWNSSIEVSKRLVGSLTD